MSCTFKITKSSIIAGLKEASNRYNIPLNAYTAFINDGINSDGEMSDAFKEKLSAKFGVPIEELQTDKLNDVVRFITDEYNRFKGSIKYSSDNENSYPQIAKYGYTSVYARDFAKKTANNFTLAAKRLVDEKYGSIDKYIADIKEKTGTQLTRTEAYLRLLKVRVLDQIKKRAENKGLASKEEIAEVLRKGNVARLEEIFGKDNSEDVNLLALYKELRANGKQFLDEAFRNNGELRKSIHQDKNIKEIELSEDISDSEIEENGNVSTKEDDAVDNYIGNLTNKLGDVGHYMSNIDNSIKLYFSAIPVLTSTQIKGTNPDGTPIYQFDTNNPLGIPDVMDTTQCINTILGYANAYNVQSLIDEIRRIANEIPGMAGLIQVADYMEKNNSFAYKLWCNFSKTIMSKIETTNKSNGFQAARTNLASNREEVLKFDFINSFKQSSITVDKNSIAKISSKLLDIRKDINSKQFELKNAISQKRIDAINSDIDSMIDSAIIHLTKGLKYFFNTIQGPAVELYIKKSDDKLRAINSLISTLNNLINHSDKAKDNYTKLTNKLNDLVNKRSEYKEAISDASKEIEDLSRMPGFEYQIGQLRQKISKYNEEVDKLNDKINETYKEDYIDSNFMSDIANFTKGLSKYSLVKLDMNSRNVHGNLSSDLLNNSMITNLIKTLNNATALANFGLNRSQSRQYDFSNVMYEERDENNNIINYGLFTRNKETGEVKPTPYAHRLISEGLYAGIADVENHQGVLYNKMGKPDYVASAVINFFNNERNYAEENNDDGGPAKFANYFMRTPSDAPKNFIVRAPVYSIKTTAGSEGLRNKGVINRNHPVYKQFRKAMVQEFQDAATAIHVIFGDNTLHGAIDLSKENLETGKEPTRLRKLAKHYHYKGDNLFEMGKDGKLHLTGNVFDSDRFIVTKVITDENGNRKAEVTNYGRMVRDEAFKFFYGESNSIESKMSTKGVEIVLNDAQNEIIDKYLEQFLKDYSEQSVERLGQYEHLLGEGTYTREDMVEFALNYHLTYISMNDLIEGDTKFYKDSQTTLKRFKEGQGSGVSYGIFDIENDPRSGREEIKNSPLHTAVFEQKIINADGVVTSTPIKIGQYTRFKAVTIKNTVKTGDSIGTFKLGKKGKPAKFVKDKNGVYHEDKKGNYIFEKVGRLSERLITALTEDGMSKQNARIHAANIMAGYYDTTVNDAQSYITFEEWVRRITARGQFEEYKPLIDAIYDETKPLDAKTIGKFIQVQKNFYFDQEFAADLGVFMPRQIKNAEFVLVPRLIAGTQLEEVYKMMIDAGIDQLNTEETSKAGKRNVLTIWNDEGEITEEAKRDFVTNAAGAIELFNYNYLYTQQETPSHLDAKNKAAIQFMKKIIDNIPKTLPDGIEHPLYKYKLRFQELYTENIQGSAEDFADEFGITIDDAGNFIVDGDHPIDTEVIYELLKDEISRQGLDSNSMDYVTLDESGKPLMPAYSGIFARKLENLVQGLVNNRITRQTLPGFHAAQITNIGFKPISDIVKKRSYSKELKYHPDEYGIKDENNNIIERISEREWLKKDETERKKYQNLGASSYVEIMLPKSNFRFKRTHKDGTPKSDEELLEELSKSGADTIIGYRIPTEGKQSMCIMKVVGFIDDAYDSTIVVPDDWVSQTGSDFDIDSVYGIHFTTELDENGKLIKARPKEVDAKDYLRFIKRKLGKILKEENIPASVRDSLKDKIDSYLSDNSEKYEELQNNAKEIYTTMKGSLRNHVNKYNSIVVEGKTKQEKYLKKLAYTIKQLNNDIKSDNFSKKEKLALNLYNDKLKSIYDFVKNQDKEFIDNVEKLKENVNVEDVAKNLSEIAEQANLPKYERWKARRTRSVNRDIRNNELLDIAITILGDNKSLEENLSRSNFEKLKDARDDIQPDYIKEVRQARSPYNFLDQADYMEDVTSGLTLKGASVARDTFVSICNTAQAYIQNNSTIAVTYKKEDGYSLAKLRKVFPEVKDNGNGIYTVLHNTLGWTLNNKNVADLVLTPYTSQTTAHILDAVKEGPIPNVNNYTFNVYKTFSDIGCDFYLSVAFMMQPAVTRIVDLNNRKKSMYYSDENINPIKDTIVEIANKLNPKGTYTAFSKIDTIVRDINTLYKDIINDKFNGNINSHILEFSSLNTRLKNNENSIENLLHDLKVVLDFRHIRELSNEIGNNARLLNPDKFGAKQTVFETLDVIDKIKKESNKLSSTIYVYNKDNRPVSLINAIYTPNIEDSVYRTLNAFYKYSTQLSVNLNRILFPEIHNKHFEDFLLSIEDSLYNVLDSNTYNTFKKYVFNYCDTTAPAIRFTPTLDEKGDIVFDEDSNSREELARIYGFSKPVGLHVKNEEDKTFVFKVEDINHPTNEEIRQFITLSPAQKVHFIKNTFEDTGIFDYIEESLSNRGKLASVQTIRYKENASDIETVYSEFEQAFFNSNPIIRLAAIDLIKYAYVVDGAVMKKGSMVKVVKNNALYATKEDNGLELTTASRNTLDDLGSLGSYELQEELKLNFIRSHPEVIPIKTIYSHKTGNFRDAAKTKPIWQKDLMPSTGGVIVVPDIATAAKYNMVITDSDGNIVATRRYTRLHDRDTKKTTLYKINEVKDKIVLTPLNLLEENEHETMSINNENNTFNSDVWYNAILENYNEKLNRQEEELRAIENDENYAEKSKAIINDKQYSITRSVQELLAEADLSKYYVKEIKNDKFAKPFDINSKDTPYTSGFEKVINKVVQRFEVDGEKHLIVRSRALRNYIIANGELFGSTQTINGKEYRITKKLVSKLNKKFLTDKEEVKSSNEDIREIYTEAQHDGANRLDDVFDIRKTDEEAKRQSSTDEISLDGWEETNPTTQETTIVGSSVRYNSTEELNSVPTVNKFNHKVVQTMYFRRRSLNDPRAIDSIKFIENKNINTSPNYINENKKLITQINADYIVNTVNDILNRLNNFRIGDKTYRLDSDEVVEAIKTDKALKEEFLKVILDARAFVNLFDIIDQIDIEAEDADVRRYLNNIKSAIGKLRSSQVVSNCEVRFGNDVLAKLSDNPMVQKQILGVFDGYHVASLFDAWINDLQETSNPLLQIVSSQVMKDLRKKEMLAQKEVQEFRKIIADIKARATRAGVSINWDKIIDENGDFVQVYNQAFLDKLKELRAAKDRAKLDFDTNPEAYYRAKLTFDKWKLENINQEANNEYYTALISLEENMLNNHTAVFIKYKTLQVRQSELLSYISEGTMSEEYAKELDEIQKEIALLSSDFIGSEAYPKYSSSDPENPYTGENRVIYSLESAFALREYKYKKSELDDYYFEDKALFNFDTELERNLGIISRREIRDANGKLLTPISELMEDPDYVAAKEWINNNTYFSHSSEIRTKLNKAFTTLREAQQNIKTHQTPRYVSILAKLNNAFDKFGIVDATKIKDEDIAKIKANQEREYQLDETNPFSDRTLISNAPDDDVVFSADFYNRMRSNGVSNKVYIAKVQEINNILREHYDPTTRTVNTSELSSIELSNLDRLYTELNELKKNEEGTATNGKSIFVFIRDNVEFVYNQRKYDEEESKAKAIADKMGGLAGRDYLRKWRSVNNEMIKDKNGNSKVVPNHFLYGYAIPKGYKKGEEHPFVDKLKTDALRFIKENSSVVPTIYYHRKYAEMRNKSEDEFKAWFDANHIYNPYTHRLEPLKCWTTLEVKDENDKGNYMPKFNYRTRVVKEDRKNPNYIKDGSYAQNYNGRNTAYNNTVVQNQFEQELSNLFKEKVNKYAITDQAKNFFKQGHAPMRKKKEELTAAKVGKELLKLIGYVNTATGKEAWLDDEKVDYSTDATIDMPLTTLLKSKETVDVQRNPPKRKQNQTAEEYKEEYDKWYTEKEEAITKNKQINKDLLDRNWESVMEEYIIRGSAFNAVQNNKYMLFYVKNMLDKQQVYVKNLGFNKLQKTGQRTIDGKVEYASKTDNNLRGQYINWLRRIVYEQYKKPNNKLTRVANVMQSVTSAKYMMFNASGGVANVTQGWTQILGERFARDYFGNDWWKGVGAWNKSIGSFLFDMNKDKATSLGSAIAKAFNIVDFTEINGLVQIPDAAEYIDKLRDASFGFLSIGEHFMQNSALFTMLYSHRLYYEPDNTKDGRLAYTYKSLGQVRNEAMDRAFKEMVDGTQFAQLYEEFVAYETSRPDYKKNFVEFREDLTTKFVTIYMKDKLKDLYSLKKKVEEDIIKEFNNDEIHPTLMNQLDISKDGYLKFKDGSTMATRMTEEDAFELLAGFKGRVISVNKKIHGIYDKLGAAQFENKWGGSLVTQYHKHLYPGIMKRWRRQGYFNEERGTVEKGSNIALFDFIALPFHNDRFVKKLKADNNMSDSQLQTVEGFQNICKAYVHFATNFKLYFNMLPRHEQANILRGLNDFVGVAVAVSGAVALQVLGSDDEDSFLYNFLINQADRLATESMSMRSIGIVGEGKKLWSSPIAAQNLVTDVGQLLSLCAQYVIQGDEFDLEYTSGVYKGENKFTMLIKRNTPIVHSMYMLERLQSNNKTYKLDENMLSIIPVKKIADSIKD